MMIITRMTGNCFIMFYVKREEALVFIVHLEKQTLNKDIAYAV